MIITIIDLVIATAVTALFIIMMIKGGKSDYMLESLTKNTFQLKELYSVGFGWSDTIPALSYGSELSDKVQSGVVILYGERYAEYYTRVYLAKIATFAHIVILVTSIVGAMASGVVGLFIIIAGIFAGFFVGKVYADEPKKNVEQRAEDCVIEFPNLVTKLALLLNAGITLREAWYLSADSAQGELKNLMRYSCDLMENGKSENEAITAFGIKSGSEEIRKFSISIIQSIEKGNAELASAMMQQSAELWSLKKQKLLQKGEKAATKLVIPTSLMFIGAILVVLSSAISGMSF